MGGKGSGRKRAVNVRTTDDIPSILVSDLRRAKPTFENPYEGFFRAKGVQVYFVVVPVVGKDNSFAITVTGSSFGLTVTGFGRSQFETETLLEVKSLYGGERLQPFFTCPECVALRRELYLDGSSVRCKGCAGLRSPSQVVGKRGRERLRADKIRGRLVPPPIPGMPCQRPTGMSKSAYVRDLKKLEALDAAGDAKVFADLDQFSAESEAKLARLGRANGLGPPEDAW